MIGVEKDKKIPRSVDGILDGVDAILVGMDCSMNRVGNIRFAVIWHG